MGRLGGGFDGEQGGFNPSHNTRSVGVDITRDF
jgi:hypothetical protein